MGVSVVCLCVEGGVPSHPLADDVAARTHDPHAAERAASLHGTQGQREARAAARRH